jgi:predicted O-methyltransferase YrrM
MARLEEVKAVVGELPHMTLERAEVITTLIREHEVRDVLELGFCHGVSTCYMAAALEERGEGHIVTIDRATRLAHNTPPVEELLSALSVRDRVTLFYEYSSYNWRLYHFLTQDVQPEFDLIYLDGAHTWEADGFAFLLAEQLLAPGGHIVFDDLHWSFATSASARNHTLHMPSDERDLAQVELICHHLVRPHPNIDEYWEDRNLAFAHKRAGERRDVTTRDAALALIKDQAEVVRERSEEALRNRLWEFQPWPSALQTTAAAADRRELGELRYTVTQLEKLLEGLSRRMASE